MIAMTYMLQAWTAVVGAACLLNAWEAYSQGRSIMVAFNVVMALLNGWLFCVQAALRIKGKGL